MTHESFKCEYGHHDIGPWIGHAALDSPPLHAATIADPDGRIATTVHNLTMQLLESIRGTADAGADITPSGTTISFRKARPPEGSPASPIYSFFDGGLRIDTGRQTVAVAQSEVHFAAQEFNLLQIFASRPDQAITHEELAQLLWGDNFQRQDTLKTTICGVRAKLGDYGARIKSVRFVGYRFSPESDKQQHTPALWLGHAALQNLLRAEATPGPDGSIVTTVEDLIAQLSNAISASPEPPSIRPDDVVVIYQAAEHSWTEDQQSETYSYFDGGLTINIGARTVTVDGTEVCLAKREFDVLHALVAQPDKILTSKELLEAVGDCNASSALYALYDAIRGVRNKLGPYAQRLIVIKNVGYRFRLSEPDVDMRHDNANRAEGNTKSAIHSLFDGRLVIDEEHRTVTVDGAVDRCTGQVLIMLSALAASPGTTFTRKTLRKLIWGTDDYEADRKLQARAQQARRKLRKYGKCLVTVRGKGYRLDAA